MEEDKWGWCWAVTTDFQGGEIPLVDMLLDVRPTQIRTATVVPSQSLHEARIKNHAQAKAKADLKPFVFIWLLSGCFSVEDSKPPQG